MKKTSQELHQESIEFISNNINTQTSEIPKCLLEYWCVPQHINNYFESPDGLNPYLIFQYAHNTYYKTIGREVELSAIEKIVLFEQFQLLVRVTLGKEKVVKINPVNLFDFDNYSKLNITIS